MKNTNVKRTVVAVTGAMLLATSVAGAARAQTERDSELVWRRAVVPGLSRVSGIADVASDGTIVAAAATLTGKKGDKVQVWVSPDGRTEWAAVTSPPASAAGRLDIDHGPDGWRLYGPSPSLTSTDGVEWIKSESDATTDEASVTIGGHVYSVDERGAIRAPAGTDDWTPVEGLDGIALVAATSNGGIGIGDGTVATSDDGDTWTRSPAPLLEGAVLNAIVGLDDGSAVALGSAPGYRTAMLPAIWIGEPSDRVTHASVEDSAARYTELADKSNVAVAKLDKRVARTFAQVHKIARGYRDNIKKFSRGVGDWQWPPEASQHMAAMIAVLEATADVRDQQTRTKNDKQLRRTVKQLDKLRPAALSAAVGAREALGLPISKAVRKALRDLEKSR